MSPLWEMKATIICGYKDKYLWINRDYADLVASPISMTSLPFHTYLDYQYQARFQSCWEDHKPNQSAVGYW